MTTLLNAPQGGRRGVSRRAAWEKSRTRFLSTDLACERHWWHVRFQDRIGGDPGADRSKLRLREERPPGRTLRGTVEWAHRKAPRGRRLRPESQRGFSLLTGGLPEPTPESDPDDPSRILSSCREIFGRSELARASRRIYVASCPEGETRKDAGSRIGFAREGGRLASADDPSGERTAEKSRPSGASAPTERSETGGKGGPFGGSRSEGQRGSPARVRAPSLEVFGPTDARQSAAFGR